MPNFKYFQKQAQKSIKQKQTTKILAQAIFKMAEHSLREIYGEDISIRCLQSSYAIQEILRQLGIKSKIFGKDFCILLTDKNTPHCRWGGFWDKDHHAWLQSEFHEVIDLTVSQIHCHPVLKSKHDNDPVPPLWTGYLDSLPSVIKYLPTQKMGLDLNEDYDAKLLKELLAYVNFKKNSYSLMNFELEELSDFKIIYDTNSLDELSKIKNSWANKISRLDEVKLPPSWILSLENHLLVNSSRKQNLK